MKDMKAMLSKKKDGKKDNKKAAKRKVLEEMHKMASDMMTGDMKKVTVAAKDDKGLMAGLEKAEEILKKKKHEDS